MVTLKKFTKSGKFTKFTFTKSGFYCIVYSRSWRSNLIYPFFLFSWPLITENSWRICFPSYDLKRTATWPNYGSRWIKINGQLNPRWSMHSTTQIRTTLVHTVFENHRKSHLILRANRAKFAFWVDKSLLKMPKMVNFGEFQKTWSLRSNSVTRQVNV